MSEERVLNQLLGTRIPVLAPLQISHSTWESQLMGSGFNLSQVQKLDQLILASYSSWKHHLHKIVDMFIFKTWQYSSLLKLNL